MRGGKKKFIFLPAIVFAFLLFQPNQANATTLLAPTTITTSTIWTAANSPYIIAGWARISVTGILTIEPGVVVKFSAGNVNGLEAGNGGRIVANGTADQPIVFTSYHDDTVGGDSDRGASRSPHTGDWQGISLADDASEFSHVIIRYGGLDIRGQSRAHISDTAISANSGPGLILSDGATPTLERLTIDGNDGEGIFSFASSQPITVTDSIISNNRQAAISTPVNGSLRFVNTSFTGNNLQTIALNNTTTVIDRDTTWQYIQGLTYTNYMMASITINPGVTLTIEPGVNVKTIARASYYVRGTLIANGTEAQPITFTSYSDDTIGGDTNGDGSTATPEPGPLGWNGIAFDQATGSLSHFQVFYSGYPWGEHNVIHLDNNSNVAFDAITIDHGLDTGIRIDGNSTLTLNNSTIAHVPTGLVNTAPAPIILRGNTFTGNTVAAVWNGATTTIDARHNFWGDDSGPAPSGRGGRVIGNVLYDPWIGKRDPVILVPGILGSEMKIGNDVIWPDPASMLFSPSDDFMDVLQMNENGTAIDGRVGVGDIFRGISLTDNLGVHIFDYLIEKFQEEGYTSNDLFVFPYDWRLSIKTNSDRLGVFIADHTNLTITRVMWKDLIT